MATIAWDFFLFLTLLYGFLRGYKHGPYVEIFYILLLLLAIFFAAFWGKLDGGAFSLFLFLLTAFILGAGAFWLTKFWSAVVNDKLKESGMEMKLSKTGRIFGGFFGVIRAGFVVSSLLLFINQISVTYNLMLPETRSMSILYEPIIRTTPFIFSDLSPERFTNKIIFLTEEEKAILQHRVLPDTTQEHTYPVDYVDSTYYYYVPDADSTNNDF